MLEELRITSLGVIEESVLELGAGLTVITGETGAGKTMVVTALGLLLGGRADASAVRASASRARVEGLVRLAPAAARAVEDLGGDVEDGRVLLARQVSSEGRSRAFAGGAAVPATALATVTESLVAVHGQSDQMTLLRGPAQRDLLDRFAGAEAMELRRRVEEDLAALKATDRDLAALLGSARERAREADLVRLGLAEISQASPVPEEDVALAEEESRLGYADALRLAAEQARECLSAEDGPDALGSVAAARRLLEGVREHDPKAARLAGRLAEVSYLLADLAADVASYASDLEADPARLAAVSERRSVLSGLTRKYGETLDEVLSWAATASERLLELEDTDGRIELLTTRRQVIARSLGETAGRLSGLRVAAASRLGAAVTAELGALALPHATVGVTVDQTEDPSGLDVRGRRLRCGASGIDDVRLLMTPHRGSEPRPLDRGASGGELSRVMLALEVALAGTNPVPTMVFDEVDAGVGGRAAVEVGRRLAMLARHAQVLVVTHLPQVAAFADHHVVVVKSDDGVVTTSGLRVLDDEGRLRELSRMLAGLEDSSTALAHAHELLETARPGRAATR